MPQDFPLTRRPQNGSSSPKAEGTPSVFSKRLCLRFPERHRILPVFLPFLGCPARCVYCAQDRQTGVHSADSVQRILEEAEAKLAPDTGEIAFYGGTFTSLPPADRRLCLSFYASAQKKIRGLSARCSTRPDALPAEILAELRGSGLGLIELGIQSFDDEALALTRRGYTGKTAEEGCRSVTDAGFRLGIQLLPGMPGCTPEIFLNDVKKALSFHPSCLRFYPCLVPDGTPLAQWYRQGRYAPWTHEETVAALGKGLLLAWKADTPVIRLSVAPEPSFDAAVLAGPRHPALGALIQAEALLLAAEEAVSSLPGKPVRLELPHRCQGFIWGNRGSLKPRWQALGLDPSKIVFSRQQDALLMWKEEK